MSAMDAVFERFGRGRVRYVRPVPRAQASGLVKSVYDQLAREFQVAPPMTVHSPVPRLLAAVWSAGRETLIAGDARVTKEAIAAAVSAANTCPFCVDVHSVMLDAGGRRDVAAALAMNRVEAVEDPALRAIVQWALATARPDDPLTREPPMHTHQAAAYLGTAVVFHYLNRVVNVFMRDGSPLALPRGLGWLRGGMARAAARAVGRPTLGKAAAAGGSLDLPDAPVLSGIGWIDAHPTIGPALSHLFVVADDGGRELMSAETTGELDAVLDRWRGEDPPLGRRWIEEPLRAVPARDAPVATLALLSARASYTVGDDDIAAFRATHPGDADLVRVVAWGAAAAARRIASWLRAPGGRP